MPIHRTPFGGAGRRAKAAQGFDLRLVIVAVALFAFVLALLVDRDGVTTALSRIGQIGESGMRLVASVDQPF